MADTDLIVSVRIAELLFDHEVNLPPQARKDIEAVLADWESELRAEAKEEGHSEGYDAALEAERIVDDLTMQDLETGLSLASKGDPCASTYLDRALRDLGSGYVGGAML